MKIRPVGAQLFQPDGLDEANSRFFNFANAPKKKSQAWQEVTELGESLDEPRQYFRDTLGVKLAKKGTRDYEM